jgi:dTDP-4-dehydrorhamnose 3,5-epimerase
MRIEPVSLADASVIIEDRYPDDRGFFAQTYCEKTFAEHGLDTRWVHCNWGFNTKAGTLRGMHFQTAPYQEVKLVRCTKGAVLDVIIDLRPESPTFKQWVGVELTDSNQTMLYIPKGFAHGYQTLVDGSEVFYLVSEFYTPSAQAGVRWNDPTFNIAWPDVQGERIISERDLAWGDYRV